MTHSEQTSPSLLRVLHVEDNPGDARLLQKMLTKSKYARLLGELSFVRAGSVDEATAALEREALDVVLLDLGLPDSRGLRTLQLFDQYLSKVPFIVLTGLDDPDLAARAVGIGAHDYLNKNELDGEQAARALRYAVERQHALKKMHARMSDLDRVITMGTLAAGAAHEINNPLAFTTSNIQYAISLLEKSPPHAELPEPLATNLAEVLEALGDALEGSNRVRSVVRDLRKLAGAGPETANISIEPIDLVETLESSLNIARNHIAERARLVTDLQDLPEVLANPAKMGQVFLNLLINAAQAIPHGHIDDNEVRVRAYTSDKQVVVEISDTGRGIPEEERDKIFEPFFSTKHSSEGIGLGLAISHQIVKNVSGEIEVDSTVGEGTTFRVKLPHMQWVFEQVTEVEPL